MNANLLISNLTSPIARLLIRFELAAATLASTWQRPRQASERGQIADRSEDRRRNGTLQGFRSAATVMRSCTAGEAKP
jgi:hypothetical protein